VKKNLKKARLVSIVSSLFSSKCARTRSFPAKRKKMKNSRSGYGLGRACEWGSIFLVSSFIYIYTHIYTYIHTYIVSEYCKLLYSPTCARSRFSLRIQTKKLNKSSVREYCERRFYRRVPGVDLLLRNKKEKERKKSRSVSSISSFSIEVCPVSIFFCEKEKKRKEKQLGQCVL